MKRNTMFFIYIATVTMFGCEINYSSQGGQGQEENIAKCIKSQGFWENGHCVCQNTHCPNEDYFCNGNKCIECYDGQSECEANIQKQCIDGKYIKTQCKDGCEEDICKENKCEPGYYRCKNYYEYDKGTFGQVEQCVNNKWSKVTECKEKEEYTLCKKSLEYTPIDNQIHENSDNLCACKEETKICDNEKALICKNGSWITNYECSGGCDDSNPCKIDESLAEIKCVNENDIGHIYQYENGELIIDYYCSDGALCSDDKTCNECKNGRLKCVDGDGDKPQICEKGKWKETGEKTICKDNISYYSCIDGSFKETECDHNTYCKEGKCIACEDGETQCSADNKVQICEGGKWKEYNETTCNINTTCLNGSYIDGNCYCQNDSTVEICTTDCGSTGCYPAEQCSENMCLFNSFYICESSGSLKKVQGLSYYTPEYYTPESSSKVDIKEVFGETQICKLNNKILLALKDNLLNPETSQGKSSLKFETHFNGDNRFIYQWQIDDTENQNAELSISVNSQNNNCDGNNNTIYNLDNFDLCNIHNVDECWTDALEHLKNNVITNIKFAVIKDEEEVTNDDYKDIRVDLSGMTCNSNHITSSPLNFNVDMLNVEVYGCDGKVCDECIPGQYQCNENTLKFCKELTTPSWKEINCANGCSNGACNPCDETTTKCEDNMKYECNGNDQWSDPKPCPNGCDKEGKTCAEACNTDSAKSYSDWYNLLKHNSNSISNLNSLIMDMYLFNCQNLQETGQWSVFEFNNDVNSNEAEKSIFVIISNENGRCDYDITQELSETVDISEMESSVCDYLENCNSNCKIKELTGKLSYQYKCETPSGGSKNVKTCKEEMKLENLDNLNNILIYGTCNNGEWNQFKIKPDATPAMICPNY